MSYQVGHFLHHINKCEHAQIAQVLKTNTQLLFQKGQITDYLKQEFNEISPFQYAVWLLDWRSLKLMSSIIFANKDIALKQLNEILKSGVFNIAEIIDAITTYIENHGKWCIDECNYHWRHVVGMAQRKLPLWIVFEYCRNDRPIYELPKKDDSTLPTTHSWLPLEEKKGPGYTGAYVRHYVYEDFLAITVETAERELKFVTALSDIVHGELIALENQLTQPNTQPKPF